MDPEGYLFLHDRIKDMIVSGAENIYPAEVENVVFAHPGVADVAVIGVPDDKWGETVKAIVVRSSDVVPDGLDRDGTLRQTSSPLPATAWPTTSARRRSPSPTRCPETQRARS